MTEQLLEPVQLQVVATAKLAQQTQKQSLLQTLSLKEECFAFNWICFKYCKVMIKTTDELQRNTRCCLFCLFLFFFSSQFQLSHSDKELLEREDRGESQQEILRRIAKDLPIYTRTNSGGTQKPVEPEERRLTPL